MILRPPRLLSRLDRERPANQMRRIFLSLPVWVAIFLHRSSSIESMKATENSRQSSHPWTRAKTESGVRPELLHRTHPPVLTNYGSTDQSESLASLHNSPEPNRLGFQVLPYRHPWLLLYESHGLFCHHITSNIELLYNYISLNYFHCLAGILSPAPSRYYAHLIDNPTGNFYNWSKQR